MIIQAFAFAPKKFIGEVEVSEENFNKIKTEIYKENFCFEENGKKIPANIIVLRNKQESLETNPSFSKYIDGLIG